MISCLCFWWFYKWSTEKGGSAGVFTASVGDMSWVPLLYFSGLNCTYFPWHFFLLKIYCPVPLCQRIFSLLGLVGDNSGSAYSTFHYHSKHTLQSRLALKSDKFSKEAKTTKLPVMIYTHIFIIHDPTLRIFHAYNYLYFITYIYISL